MPGKLKGHWPAGKRRHPVPPDWAAICRATDQAFARRQGRLLASKIGVHRDTILRWRRGVDVPAPAKVKELIAGLYALHLYRVKMAGR